MQGVEVVTARRYFRRHWAGCAPVLELFESLAAAAAEEQAQGGDRRTSCRPHLSPGALDEGLANGSLMRVCLTTIATQHVSIVSTSTHHQSSSIIHARLTDAGGLCIKAHKPTCLSCVIANQVVGICDALQGVIHMSRRGPAEATVQIGSAVESELRQVWVLGVPAVNRALHGDAVAVRLLPR